MPRLIIMNTEPESSTELDAADAERELRRVVLEVEKRIEEAQRRRRIA